MKKLLVFSCNEWCNWASCYFCEAILSH